MRMQNGAGTYSADVVWNAIKQTNLIDSIYRNYPVPNLVFGEPFDSHTRFPQFTELLDSTGISRRRVVQGLH